MDMIKKTRLLPIVMVVPFVLTACGEETVTTETVLSTEQATVEADASKTQRDELEEEQKVAYDQSVQDELAQIVVPAEAEEDETIRALIEETVAYIPAGTPDDAMTKLLQDDWYTTVLAGLTIGQRNYDGTTEDGAQYRVMTKSDEYGDRYAAIWYLEDGILDYVEVTPEQLTYFSAAYDGAQYNGAYTLETMDRTTGVVIKDTGTLTDGLCTGALSEQISDEVESVADVNAYWRGREDLVYTEYTGTFSDDGHTQVEQNADVTAGGEIMYATYTDENEATWFMSIEADEADAAAYTFTAETIGISTNMEAWE